MFRDNGKTKSVIILIILIACNLRAPITGVGSLTNTIREGLNLSAGMTGALTTVPLLAFALISPFAAKISRTIGAGKTIFLSVVLSEFGIIMRSISNGIGLFTGTVFIGLGIGVGNVLLPAVIKDKFPDRIESMTGLYTAVMQMTSTISTAVSVPLSLIIGWKNALLIWVIPVTAALILCFPNIKLKVSDRGKGSCAKDGRIYKSAMTWWITAYMGVQSFVFYSFIAWLSPIMQSKGQESFESGLILSVYVIMGIAGSCFLPLIMKKNRTQSATGMQLGCIYLIGIIAMIITDNLYILIAAISICGFTSGTCISFSMALFGLHTSNGENASRLSGIAQSVGYLIAAAGPVMLGKLYEITLDWKIPIGILALAAFFLIFAGRIVGKDKIIA